VDALEAIRERRMLPRVREDRPSQDEIAELLELAVRAPAHFRTEPWRFHVLAGEALDDLAQAIADEQVDSAGADPDEALAEARKKVSRAPVVVVVTCRPQLDKDGVVEQEEIVATAMALQNLLLGAYASGLGAMLRTGAASYHPAARKRLGLDDDEIVIGMVYLGYPAADREKTERAPASDKTRWLGWN